MTRLEDLTKGALVRGVLGDRAVRVVDVAWHGSNAVTLTYTDEPTGKVDQELLYRDDEAHLSVAQAGRAWSMDADGSLFRLVSEAKRISLAYRGRQQGRAARAGGAASCRTTRQLGEADQELQLERLDDSATRHCLLVLATPHDAEDFLEPEVILPNGTRLWAKDIALKWFEEYHRRKYERRTGTASTTEAEKP